MGRKERGFVRKPKIDTHREYAMLEGYYRRLDSLKGELLERKFEEIFTLGLEGNAFPAWILGYRRGQSAEEARGINGVIQTDIGKIPIQIKSSQRGGMRARRRNPGVPWVIMGINSDTLEIIGKVTFVIAKKRKELLENSRA